MDTDPPDLAGIGKAQVGPGFTGVLRPIDPVAVGKVAADAGFAHPDVNNIGIRRRHGDGTDGTGTEIAVGNVVPRLTGVFSLPHTSTGSALVVDQRLTGDTGDGRDPPAPKGPDKAPLHDLGKIDFGSPSGW